MELRRVVEGEIAEIISESRLSDVNGSGKVALVAIERSIVAWLKLRDILPAQEDTILVNYLECRIDGNLHDGSNRCAMGCIVASGGATDKKTENGTGHPWKGLAAGCGGVAIIGLISYSPLLREEGIGMQRECTSEIRRFLATGDYDLAHAVWPGRHALERIHAGEAALR